MHSEGNEVLHKPLRTFRQRLKGRVVRIVSQLQEGSLWRKEEGSGNLGCTAHIPTSPPPCIFKALLRRGGIKTDDEADWKADAKFIMAKLAAKIKQSVQLIEEDAWKPCQIYRGVTLDPCLTRPYNVRLDVLLDIGREASLNLRNIMRKVTDEGL